jgi:hypothetical protein
MDRELPSFKFSHQQMAEARMTLFAQRRESDD